MKSNLYNETHSLEYILSETERFGNFCGLSGSESVKLRLLTEETLGLTVRLFNNLEYEFFIENNQREFTLSLSVKTIVSSSQKEKMLSLSSSGKNKAVKGILGKISGVFEDMLMESREYNVPLTPIYDGMGNVMYFSMMAYLNELADTEKKEQWDGLEKSIIANLAADVMIGVKNSRVEIISTIKF